MRAFRIFAWIIALFSVATKSYASHFYGADFFYTYISGTTYRVTLIAYGDCGGSAFPSLANATADVEVYDGTNKTQNVTLQPQVPTAGTEVTPVCATASTNCTNTSSTIPGVKKFVYFADVNLGGTSANWKFRFTGNMSNSSAGRSNSITNIVGGSNGTVIVLEATLNNLNASNSSPTYTVIPTPFFNINKAANYNPGTIDPNSDSLSYALVPGLAQGGNVTYQFGYTATQPLAVSTGSFSFSNSNGQLTFTPNQVQRSLVVYRVSEYRNGVLVGTSMREMTFVVLTNPNNAPAGNLANIVGGTSSSNTSAVFCGGGTVSFNINATDIDTDNINVVASGIPGSANFNVAGNNTANPIASFSWNLNGVTPGTYTFFLTLTDDGCPLSSKQTQAFTIIILPIPGFTFNLVSPATCSKKAVFTITNNTSGIWKAKYYQGTTIIDSAASATNSVTDSLSPGTYTIRAFNNNGCSKDTVVTIINPTTTLVNAALHKPTCNIFSDGVMTISGYNSTAPYQYAIGSGAYSSSGVFSSLPAGTYTIHVKDAPGCIKDTTIVLPDSAKITGPLNVTNVLCNGDNTGALQYGATGGYGSYKYSLNSGTPVTGNNFPNLAAGAYTLHVTDVLGCYFDTSATITQPTLLVATPSQVNIDCYGSTTGSITLNVAGGVSPYQYNLNGGTYLSSPIFPNLPHGNYIVNVKDANGCMKTDTITLVQPTRLRVSTMGLIHPRCFESTDGGVIIKGTGGISPYTYSIGTQPYNSNNQVTGLPAGTYVIHIKDSNNCVLDSTITLVHPDKIIPAVAMERPTCTPFTNGSMSFSATGGVSPYFFALGESGFGTQPTFNALKSGPYKLSVRDWNNCIVDTSLYLDDSLKIKADITIRNTSCNGLSDGGFDIVPDGGIEPYQIAIDKGGYQAVFNYKTYSTGWYVIHMRDTIGCITDTSVKVGQPEKLVVDTTITMNNCYSNASVAKISLEVEGGTQPYTYLWSNNAPKDQSEISNLVNGMYSVRVVDANNCSDTLAVEVRYGDCCTPMIPTGFTPNGDGRNDLFHILPSSGMELKALSVFNRFGQRVFYTDNANSGWDGTLNGTPLDAGTYYYHIKLACGVGGTHLVQLKGDVILVR